MKRVHRMPFGAEVLGRTTRFRLWAPGARRVDVELAGGTRARALPLAPLPDGWFEAEVEDLDAGARYAYRIDERSSVPDPASRCNPDGVHAPSMTVDPEAYEWRDDRWQGRPWEEAVIYELHVGTFTPAGTFAAVAKRLDHLVELGVTAIELMPLAAFPGKRNWGYDGVLLFAPAACYGSPTALKALVEAAHARGLMVLLDVVYNHFGPEGNYLHAYAPAFFTQRHRTPWGDAINFDGVGSRTVRDFFVHNALYWLEEFHLDGLRLDAVHAIADHSSPDIVTELCAAVRDRFDGERPVHLILENDGNTADYLRRDPSGRPRVATAQWNDDFHHAAHVLLTRERDGYYADYLGTPLHDFARALAQGFVYQGQSSQFRGGKARGQPSGELPPGAFVDFLQNHDQIGNRAFGDRLATLTETAPLRAVLACMLFSPAAPMLFMGEEFGATTPFLFFCDFEAALADAVTRGRREEFGRFERFRDPAMRSAIPDPNAPTTFEASKLDWSAANRVPGSEWLAFYRHCIALRQRHIAPRLAGTMAGGTFEILREALLRVRWTLSDRSTLELVANFSSAALEGVDTPGGGLIYASGESNSDRVDPYAVAVYIEEAQ